LQKYFKLKTTFGNYHPKSFGNLYSVKTVFKYTQKEFKKLKKNNSNILEKNLTLKFRSNNYSEWQNAENYWKGAKITTNTKKNTVTLKYFSKFQEKTYYFAIGNK